MAIDYPEKPTGKDKAIAVGKAAAEHIPWLGPALGALGPILPDRFQEDEERWKREVTDELNAIARLCRRPTIPRDSLAWLFALLAGSLDSKERVRYLFLMSSGKNASQNIPQRQ